MRGLTRVASRYDFDGLELDWMRFGFHFAPGGEARGAELLTEFHRRVRQGFLALARREEKRIVVLDASLPGGSVTEAAWGRVRTYLEHVL